MITPLLLFSLPSGSEIFIIALIVLLLFGGKKIPELMKGVGKGIKSFKEGVNKLNKKLIARKKIWTEIKENHYI